MTIKIEGRGTLGTHSGPFTVFAPDDNAFAAIPASTLNNLMSRNEERSSGDNMNTIPGWDGPRQRSGRDQTCYWRIVGQRMGQGSEQRIIELFSQGVLPKRMFIKVKSSNFSGGVLFMPDIGELLPRTEGPWEVVRESGKWIRYDLEIAIENDDLVIEPGDLKFARLGTGNPINENMGSIEEMAAWLEKQMEKIVPSRQV